MILALASADSKLSSFLQVIQLSNSINSMRYYLLNRCARITIPLSLMINIVQKSMWKERGVSFTNKTRESGEVDKFTHFGWTVEQGL